MWCLKSPTFQKQDQQNNEVSVTLISKVISVMNKALTCGIIPVEPTLRVSENGVMIQRAKTEVIHLNIAIL